MNLLQQSGHTKRFSPVWVLRCLCNSSDLVKLFPQKSQLHTKGLSPECQRRCAFRWEVLPYTFPHPGMWQMCCFFFPGSSLELDDWQLGHRHLRQRLAVARGDLVWRSAAIWVWYCAKSVCPNTKPLWMGKRCGPRGDGWLTWFPCWRLHHGISSPVFGDSCLCCWWTRPECPGMKPGGMGGGAA